jgi:hypothetical protein
MMLTPFFDVRTPRGTALGRLAMLFGLMVAGGCGNPDMGRVSGRITNGGKPVANAMVVFYTPSRPVARGMTDADGRFTLSTRRYGDGAYAGSHKVSVNPTFSGPDAAAPESGGGLVPANVHDLSSTPLEMEVRAGASNTCEFDIAVANLTRQKGGPPK